MKKWAFLMGLVLALPAFAGKAPDFNEEAWNLLMAKAVDEGGVMQFGEGQELRYLERLVPQDKARPHQADYFSVVGTRSAQGFAPFRVSVVSEDWKINGEGNWDIEQWIYEVALSGDVYQILHRQLIETPAGRVLETKGLPVGGPNDPQEMARWGLLLQSWLN